MSISWLASRLVLRFVWLGMVHQETKGASWACWAEDKLVRMLVNVTQGTLMLLSVHNAWTVQNQSKGNKGQTW